MISFVLDNSVAIRWQSDTGSQADQAYAYRVLDELAETDCIVPSLWQIEFISVLLAMEKRGEATAEAVNAFLRSVRAMPIVIDTSSSADVAFDVARIAREHNLTGYDATYLELAIRERVPIATLDKKLRTAAVRAGVGIHLQGKE